MATRFATRSILTTAKQTLTSSSTSPLLRLRPLISAANNLHHLTLPPPFTSRGFASRPTTSSLSDPNPNWSNRPPKETILLDGCDFEHWLVVMEKPEGDPTRDEIIDSFIKTLATIVGSEEEARMKIYSVSTRHYFAFGALVSEELSYKLKELPKVRWVLPDSYLDVKNKDYGGEPFINGQAVPYDPKYHEEWVRNNARANERNRRNDRPRNFDRSRNFERRPNTPPMGNPNPQIAGPNTTGGPPGNMGGPSSGPNMGNPGPNMGGVPPPNNMGPPGNWGHGNPGPNRGGGPPPPQQNYTGGAPPPNNYPGAVPNHPQNFQYGNGPNSGGPMPYQSGPAPNQNSFAPNPAGANPYHNQGMPGGDMPPRRNYQSGPPPNQNNFAPNSAGANPYHNQGVPGGDIPPRENYQ